MNDRLSQILSLADAGETVAAICIQTGLRPSRVYQLLRLHRPHRKRKRQPPPDSKVPVIRGLDGAGVPPKRIAALLGVSRAYVYRVLGPGRNRGGAATQTKLLTNRTEGVSVRICTKSL